MDSAGRGAADPWSNPYDSIIRFNKETIVTHRSKVEAGLAVVRWGAIAVKNFWQKRFGSVSFGRKATLKIRKWFVFLAPLGPVE
jgi:hypothetical protein